MDAVFSFPTTRANQTVRKARDAALDVSLCGGSPKIGKRLRPESNRLQILFRFGKLEPTEIPTLRAAATKVPIATAPGARPRSPKQSNRRMRADLVHCLAHGMM